MDVLAARGVLEDGGTVVALDTSLLELGGGALREVLLADVHAAGEVDVDEEEDGGGGGSDEGSAAGGDGAAPGGHGRRRGGPRVVLRAHILRPAPGGDGAHLAAVLRRRAAFLQRSGLAPARGDAGGSA